MPSPQLTPAQQLAVLQELRGQWATDIVTAAVRELAARLSALGMVVAETPKMAVRKILGGGLCMAERAVSDPASGEFNIKAILAVQSGAKDGRPMACVLVFTATRIGGGILARHEVGTAPLLAEALQAFSTKEALLETVWALFGDRTPAGAIAAGAQALEVRLLDALTP